MRDLWTSKEVNFLKTNHRKLTLSEMATALDRSYSSVANKAHRVIGPRGAMFEEPPALSLIPTIASYVAGFIDADGYIGLIIKWRNNKPTTCVPRISISNADRELICWMAEIARFRDRWDKSYIVEREEARYQENHMHYYAQASDRIRVWRILKTVLPYLRIKKRRAELVVQFYKQHKPWSLYTLADWRIAHAIQLEIGSSKVGGIKARNRLADYIAATKIPHEHR